MDEQSKWLINNTHAIRKAAARRNAEMKARLNARDEAYNQWARLNGLAAPKTRTRNADGTWSEWRGQGLVSGTRAKDTSFYQSDVDGLDYGLYDDRKKRDWEERHEKHLAAEREILLKPYVVRQKRFRTKAEADAYLERVRAKDRAKKAAQHKRRKICATA